MPGGLKLSSVLLILACSASAEVRPPAPAPVDPEVVRYLAERERRSIENVIRLSVYFGCGGDRELRCEQFAPQDLRGIPPAIPLRALQCRESGRYPRRVRDCAFALGDESRRTIQCRVTLRELPGYHSLYWSYEAAPPPERPPASGPAISIPRVPGGPSTLACTGPLLALTRAPERIDPAPGTPARPRSPLEALITMDDYPSSAASKGQSGTIAMKLQVGPNGRVHRCTVTRSSGIEALDETACRLIRMRARFLPARNGGGQAVTSEITYSHEWRAQR